MLIPNILLTNGITNPYCHNKPKHDKLRCAEELRPFPPQDPKCCPLPAPPKPRARVTRRVVRDSAKSHALQRECGEYASPRGLIFWISLPTRFSDACLASKIITSTC